MPDVARIANGPAVSAAEMIRMGGRLSFAATIALLVLSIDAAADPPAGSDGGASLQRKALPNPLVYLRDVDASIIQDMRYAGQDNFTGAPVPGYAAPECILTRRTAEALATVQRRLMERKLSLKVYDCYRPLKAVAAFMKWVRSPARNELTMRFHPSTPRDRLVTLGYIAERSGHSRGHTVDLTVVALPRRETPSFVPEQNYGSCTAAADARAPDDGLDMGTGFDCFDTRSHLDAAGLSSAQATNRRTLVEAMTHAGFASYDREWWHFSFAAGDPGRPFDIDVAAPPGP